MSGETLVANYQALPPAAQREVETLIERLRLRAAVNARPKSEPRRRFTFDWRGGLEDMREQFTAVQLQHHLNEMR